MSWGFDWSFKFGDVLTLIGGLCMAAAFLYRRGGSDAGVNGAIMMLTKDLSEMKDQMKEVSHALTQLAVQQTKIDLLMKWYDELRRGIGRIDEPKN